MRPFTLLIKPAGPDCNLACRYCFYTPKARMFGEGPHRMTDAVLEALTQDYLQLRFEVSSLAWQGGEPTLMGLEFFEKAIELQKEYGRDGQVVSNALQTNGVLLDEQWCKFLREYRFLVGLSLDGPKEIHDHYRSDKGGRGSYDDVIRTIDLCRSHKVEFNVLVLVNDVNVGQPEVLFDFFMDVGIEYLQFVPCVERDEQSGEIAEFSVTPGQYGDFMCRIFDRWVEQKPPQVSVRAFDSIISYLATGTHSNCTFSPRCEDYVVVEHNGDVFCCDFFVTEPWRLGNVLDERIDRLCHGARKRQFAALKRKVANRCLVCRHYAMCRGGCLKDRIATDGGYNQPSYFCAGYKQFFDHALPVLRQLAAGDGLMS